MRATWVPLTIVLWHVDELERGR